MNKQECIITKCPKCRLFFNYYKYGAKIGTGRVPRILPCNCTICEECISKHAQYSNTLICPNCSANYTPDVIKNLKQSVPVNYYRFGQVSYMKITEQKLNQKENDNAQRQEVHLNKNEQTVCRSFPLNLNLHVTNGKCCKENCNAVSKKFCQDCEGYFCENCCINLHNSAKGLKKHKIQDSYHKFMKECRQHSSIVANFFCYECNEDICADCFQSQHLNHNCQDAFNMNEEQKINVDKLLKKAEESVQALKATEAKIVGDINVLQSSSSSSKVEMDINAYFAKAHAELQRLEFRLKANLSQIQTKNISRLRTLWDQVKNDFFDLDQLIQIARINIEAKSEYHVFSLIESLEEAVKKPTMYQGKPEEKLVIKPNNILQEFERHIYFEKDEEENKPLTLIKEEENIRPVVHQKEIAPNSNSTRASGNGTENKAMKTLPDSSSTSSSSTFSKNDDQDQIYPILIKGFRDYVTITSIENPELMYVQLAMRTANMQQLSNEICSNLQRLKGFPTAGGLFVVKCEDLREKYCRARFLKSYEKEGKTIYIVFLIDYGSKKHITLENFYEMSEAVRKPMAFAYLCKMHKVYPKSENGRWTNEATNLIKNMLKTNKILMVVKEKSRSNIEVELLALNGENHIPVNALLIHNGLASPSIDYDPAFYIKPKSLENSIPTEVFKKNKDYEVVLINCDDLNKMVVQKNENLRKLKIIANDLYNSFIITNKEAEKVFFPMKGMFVGAKFENDWYRADIIKLMNELILVNLIDYDRIVKVPLYDLRILPKKFLEIPIQAINVKLADVEITNKEAAYNILKTRYLSDRMNSNVKVLNMKIAEEGEKLMAVALFQENVCLNTLLVENQVAKSMGLYGEYDPNTLLTTSYASSTFYSKMMSNIQADGEGDEEDSEFLYKESPKEVLELFNSFTKEQIEILDAKNPYEIYIKFLNNKLCKYYNNLDEEIQNYYNTTTFNANDKVWKINEKCVVSIGGVFYRALIVDVREEDLYCVRGLDNAKEDVVSVNQLYELMPKFDLFPGCAVECKLSGIIPSGSTIANKWTNMSIDYLKELFENYEQFYFSKTSYNNSKLSGIIWYLKEIPPQPFDCGKKAYYSLNEMLVRNGLAFREKFQQTNIQNINNKNLHVIVINTVMQQEKTDNFKKRYKEENEQNLCEESEFSEQIVDGRGLDWLPPEENENNMNKTFPVIVTFISDDAEVLYHKLEEDQALRQMAREMTKIFDKLPLQKINWKIGQICTVKYFVDNQWYRGKIIETQKNTLKILFVDFGNIEECNLTDVNHKVMFLDIPIFVKKTLLHNVNIIKGWNQLIQIMHYNIVDKRDVVITIRKNNKAVILIEDKNFNTIINEWIVKNYSGNIQEVGEEEEEEKTEEEENVSLKPIMEMALKNYSFSDKITMGSKIKAAIIKVLSHNEIIIELEHKNNEEEFHKFQENLNSQVFQQPILLDLKVNEICLAEYDVDKVWYRAQICSLDELKSKGKVFVWFIDYGNFENVAKDKIKQIPKNLMDFPANQQVAKIPDLLQIKEKSKIESLLTFLQSFEGHVKPIKILSTNPLNIKIFENEDEEGEAEENDILLYKEYLF